MSKTTLIYGSGAMGSFLGACLFKSGHKVYLLSRKKNYDSINKYGLKINIFNNNLLLKKIHLKKNKKFIFVKSIKEIKIKSIDNIFITTKITSNIKNIFTQVERFVSKKTLIITPCTSLPFWWYLGLKKKYHNNFERKLNSLFLRNIKRKNLVGMTMWLSGKIHSPGNIHISHIQRGFPIKEVFKEKKLLVARLRKDIKKNCISPNTKNIFFEIFIKSLNSLAFNLIALKYKQNNYYLKKNFKAKSQVLKILTEGDNILKNFNFKIYQKPRNRISQTLKSENHTMSMLFAYKNNKEIEIRELWESFNSMLKIVNLKMKFTNKIFNIVKKNIYDNT